MPFVHVFVVVFVVVICCCFSVLAHVVRKVAHFRAVVVVAQSCAYCGGGALRVARVVAVVYASYVLSS